MCVSRDYDMWRPMQSCSIHSKYILSIDRVKGPENMIPFLIGLAPIFYVSMYPSKDGLSLISRSAAADLPLVVSPAPTPPCSVPRSPASSCLSPGSPVLPPPGTPAFSRVKGGDADLYRTRAERVCRPPLRYRDFA